MFSHDIHISRVFILVSYIARLAGRKHDGDILLYRGCNVRCTYRRIYPSFIRRYIPCAGGDKVFPPGECFIVDWLVIRLHSGSSLCTHFMLYSPTP